MSDFWYSIEEDLEETRKCLKETEQELQRKDNIINEMKKTSDEIFHKYPYERKKWFDKIKELEDAN